MGNNSRMKTPQMTPQMTLQKATAKAWQSVASEFGISAENAAKAMQMLSLEMKIMGMAPDRRLQYLTERHTRTGEKSILKIIERELNKTLKKEKQNG